MTYSTYYNSKISFHVSNLLLWTLYVLHSVRWIYILINLKNFVFGQLKVNHINLQQIFNLYSGYMIFVL